MGLNSSGGFRVQVRRNFHILTSKRKPGGEISGGSGGGGGYLPPPPEVFFLLGSICQNRQNVSLVCEHHGNAT